MLQLGFCRTQLRLPAPVTTTSPKGCLMGAPRVRGSLARLQPLPQRLRHLANASDSSGPQASPPADGEAEDEVVLQPEEDWVVPGTMADAMKAGTKLGKAVNSACDELTTLGTLETDVLGEAQKLLERVGFKGSLFQQQQQQALAADPPSDEASS